MYMCLVEFGRNVFLLTTTLEAGCLVKLDLGQHLALYCLGLILYEFEFSVHMLLAE